MGIMLDAVQKAKERVDERMFVDQLNTLTRDDLANVLAQEKQRLFIDTLVMDVKYLGLPIVEAGFFAGLTYFF